MNNRLEDIAKLFAQNYGQENAKLGKDVKMSVAEVIAMNIQVSQLKQVIPQYEWNDKRFQEEKDYFLWWITNPKLGGRYQFTDNLSAWEQYKLVHEVLEIDDEEEFTPSWMEEIDNAINHALRAGNYSDYGGQL